MPLLFGPKDFTPGWMRRGPSEVTGESLGTSSPGTWQRDPGVMSVKSEDWGSPGAGYKASGTQMPSGPYAGYSRRSVLGMGRPTSLSKARSVFSGPNQVRTPSGMLVTSAGAPSRSNPKRLWNYQFANLAPGNTTLGRMRTLYSGFNPTMLRA